MKIYVAAVEALRKNKRGDETQFRSQLFHFVKFHLHLRIWRPILQKLAVLGPPNRLTLLITLIVSRIWWLVSFSFPFYFWCRGARKETSFCLPHLAPFYMFSKAFFASFFVLWQMGTCNLALVMYIPYVTYFWPCPKLNEGQEKNIFLIDPFQIIRLFMGRAEGEGPWQQGFFCL